MSADPLTQSPPEAISHGSIFKRFWPQISGTFALLTVENVLGVAEPLVLGIAINRLVEQDWTGLAWLAALELTFIIVGIVRRMYDTRVYTRIYARVGSDLVAREQAKGSPITQVNARADLIKEVVDFFEQILPLSLTAGFTLIGSLVMIAFLDFRVFVVATVATVLTGLVFWIASKRIHTLNKALNNQYERQIEVFERMRASSRNRHFRRLAMWQVRLSDLESLNFGLTYLFLIAAMLFGIYDAVTRLDAPIGTVFALMTYLFQFVQSVVALPITYQQGIRTSEITQRVSD
ncbi:MAG: ABC transporter six-transmembrane domain-containing protein [Maricaulis sp.]|jgi:ABC-type multidrug transport system fused ATPase/permease subunit|uniref:ABC transporter six-transmembrane domain-containing protein n=1 Tax=Maricaulis sp. TaxID=1486257 RepID=UPI001B1FC0F1|nr:ABC transporter six-transmembrane domain-containing protein [Maricaulis sp.]MBO6728566.1 hypothetical protein [Maricaulis sp.]MBO6845906.1 hypothetical protein [Maricaulis sp.]MBO6876218.1 hypothetical protein [Maricaulis sp.]MDM7984374.1 ABC transporter six-transmembrane domain-containing protein [Maricaulis sp.]